MFALSLMKAPSQALISRVLRLLSQRLPFGTIFGWRVDVCSAVDSRLWLVILDFYSLWASFFVCFQSPYRWSFFTLIGIFQDCLLTFRILKQNFLPFLVASLHFHWGISHVLWTHFLLEISAG
jgi:hypothetical protein